MPPPLNSHSESVCAGMERGKRKIIKKKKIALPEMKMHLLFNQHLGTTAGDVNGELNMPSLDDF